MAQYGTANPNITWLASVRCGMDRLAEAGKGGDRQG